MQIKEPELAADNESHPFETVIQKAQWKISEAIGHINQIDDRFVPKEITRSIKVSL